MKMFSAGGGFGLGIKDYIAVFVFHTDAAMEQFVSEGWDFSGQADAKVDDGMANKEGAELAITAMPGTSLYQITNKGVSAQVTLQGTKFWKDEELN
jgi:lipid-binding SYLF domain-containing protein